MRFAKRTARWPGHSLGPWRERQALPFWRRETECKKCGAIAFIESEIDPRKFPSEPELIGDALRSRVSFNRDAMQRRPQGTESNAPRWSVMSNIAFLLNTFVGLLAIWGGAVLLFLALWPPMPNPFERPKAMSSMSTQTVTPPYEAEKMRRR